jgi:hypothetical protein
MEKINENNTGNTVSTVFDMPYGYYQFVRFVSMAGLVYLAYSANEQHHKNEMFIILPWPFIPSLFQDCIKELYGISWM